MFKMRTLYCLYFTVKNVGKMFHIVTELSYIHLLYLPASLFIVYYFLLGKLLSRDDPSVINISDEMSKTAMWGNLLVTADNSKDKESRFPSKRFEF